MRGSRPTRSPRCSARCAPSPISRASARRRSTSADASHESSGLSRRRVNAWLRGGRARALRSAGPRYVIGSVLLLRAEALDAGRRVRRALLPLRRGDRLGLSRASARMAACAGAAACAPCTSVPARAPTPRAATRTSTRRRSGTCASTSARSAGSRRGPAHWLGCDGCAVDRASRASAGRAARAPSGALPARARSRVERATVVRRAGDR